MATVQREHGCLGRFYRAAHIIKSGTLLVREICLSVNAGIFMVEAAGVEPASASEVSQETTCLFRFNAPG